MTTAGRKLYEWANSENPNAEFWDDMTAVSRRWWNREARRVAALRPLTWPQRLAIWALAGMVCWGAIAGLVGLVWYLVSRW